MKSPKLTHYVSEIDQFLAKFDQLHPELSLAQKKEQAKYQRIYYLRDVVSQEKPVLFLWEDF